MKDQITLVKKENYFHSVIRAKSVNQITLDNWTIGIEIEWYASTKDKDRVQDIVEPTAFQSAIDMYMTNPVILLQHDHNKPVWVVTATQIVKNKGLYFKGLITEDTDGLFSKLNNWVLRALSIGYRVKDYEVQEKNDEQWNIIGYDYIIKELELFEISIVSVPANPYALLKSMDSCFEYQNGTKTAQAVEKGSGNDIDGKDLLSNLDPMEKKFDEIVAEQKELEEEVSADAAIEEEKTEEVTDEPATTETVEAPVEDEPKTIEETTQIDEPVAPEKPENPAWNSEDESEKSFKALKDENLALTKKINDLEVASNSKIESLEKWMTEMSDVLKKTLEYLVGLKKLIADMPINKGYTFEKVETRKSAYGSTVDALKSLNH